LSARNATAVAGENSPDLRESQPSLAKVDHGNVTAAAYDEPVHGSDEEKTDV